MWALWYAAHGWAVFPCEPGGKRPATWHGFKDAVSREELICDAFHPLRQRRQPLNIGVSTGWPGGPDVLDVDVRLNGNGWGAYHWLKRSGMLAGARRLVRTRAGGLHVYFAGTQQRSGSLKDLHVDFKSGGGYVLVPPSYVDEAHTDDGIAGSYVLLEDRPPTGATFDWEGARQLLCPPRPRLVRSSGYCRGPGSAGHLVAWLEGEVQGNRNNGLFWACCRALEAGDESVIDDLADVALSAGLGHAEVRRTVASAYGQVNGER
jgi:hypothetical protein